MVFHSGDCCLSVSISVIQAPGGAGFTFWEFRFSPCPGAYARYKWVGISGRMNGLLTSNLCGGVFLGSSPTGVVVVEALARNNQPPNRSMIEQIIYLVADVTTAFITFPPASELLVVIFIWPSGSDGFKTIKI